MTQKSKCFQNHVSNRMHFCHNLSRHVSNRMHFCDNLSRHVSNRMHFCDMFQIACIFVMLPNAQILSVESVVQENDVSWHNRGPIEGTLKHNTAYLETTLLIA